MSGVLDFVAALPLWYWGVGVLVLLALITDSAGDVKDAVLNLLSGLATLALLIGMFLLWPVVVVVSTMERNRSHQRGRTRTRRTPEWFLKRWSRVPRSFGHHWGRWMVAGRWLPELTTHPVQYLPQHTSIVDGRTLTVNLLVVEVAITRLSATQATEEVKA